MLTPPKFAGTVRLRPLAENRSVPLQIWVTISGTSQLPLPCTLSPRLDPGGHTQMR